MARVIVLVLVLGVGGMGLSGGLWSAQQSAEPTVQAFLLDWQQQQYAAAAALTTGRPAVVAKALRSAYTQLDAAAFYLSMGPISQRGDSAHADFGAWVDLGQDGAPWTYRGSFTLRRSGGSWRVVWRLSVIYPTLRPGFRLALRSSAAPRADLLDSSGHPLQVPSSAYVLGVRPDRLRDPQATARALGRAVGLDPGQLLGWILAAPTAAFQELLVMRPSRYRQLAPRLRRVPGLIVRTQTLRLFDSIAPALVGSVGTEDSPALREQGVAYRPGATIGLSGLQAAFQHQLAGTPTTEVVAETADGRHVSVIKSWAGKAPTGVRTTISAPLQRAAQSTVRSLPWSAAMVAVQASTGHVLAVAAHRSRGEPKIDPLAGRYPPGAAFTVVSAQALLASGLRVNRTVPCNSVIDVGGTVFHNVPPVALGPRPTFSADFAKACSTAFSGLSRRLSYASLQKAAAGFGIGTSWRLFPLRAFSGSLGASRGVAALAANTIGQGSVQMSPLAMALVAAHVDSGAWHAPALVAGHGGAQPASPGAPVFDGALGELRALMRGAARSSGAAAGGGRHSPVAGQQGTAPIAVRGHRMLANWFVGYRGDVAFAVLVLSHGHVSAARVAASFLAASP